MSRFAHVTALRTPGTAEPVPNLSPAALQQVVAELATALGLQLGDINVRADDDSSARVRARGALGLAQGSNVDLDQNLLSGPRPKLRRVLAHEGVHVAQRQQAGCAVGRLKPSAPAAEREAEWLARRFADGRNLRRPLATLPSHHVAADVDWAGLADLRASLNAFDSVVAESRPFEWQTVRAALSSDERIPEGEVDTIVVTLAAVPIPIARAILRGLPEDARWDVYRHLSATHVHVHRPVAIASLAALAPPDMGRVTPSTLERLDLRGLTPTEHDVLLLALSELPAAVMTQLLERESADPDRPQLWHGLATGEGITLTPEALRTQREAESARERPAPTVDVQSVAAVIAALIDAGQPETLTAIDRINALQPADRTAVVERLEATSKITRLIERVDNRSGNGQVLSQERFGRVLAARSAAANRATIADRLAGGIFGWDWTEDIAITQADAMIAYWALAGLPLEVREQVLRGGSQDQGDVLDRMQRNLPTWFVESPAFRSLSVGRTAEDRLYERGQAQGTWTPQLAEFLGHVRQLLTDDRNADALRALDEGLIFARGEYDAPVAQLPMNALVRSSLVDRLDAWDLMDAFLEDLPEGVRQGRDHRQALLRVCAARSVPALLHHIDSLLTTGLLAFDWAVRSWEADLAYVLFRSLPPYEQQRFARLGLITGEMSGDIRTWSGTNILSAEATTTRAAQVREQLRDRGLWTARNAGQLRAVVALAEALGEHRAAFAASREFRADTNAALAPIVAAFELYREPDRTVYQERALENTPWYNEGPTYWLTLVGGFAWLALRDAAAGDFVFDPFSGRISHRDLDLAEVGSTLGGTAGPARFARRGGPDPSGRSGVVGSGANRVQLTYDQREDSLSVSIPELVIDGLGLLGETWSANVGAIRVNGLQLSATFDRPGGPHSTGNVRHPRMVNVNAPTVAIDDVVFATPSDAYVLAHLGLHGFQLNGVPSTSNARSTTGRGFWTHIPIFGPLIEWVYLLAQTIGLGMNAAGDINLGVRELRSLNIGVQGATIDGMLIGGTPIEHIGIGPMSVMWDARPENPDDDARLDELIRRSYQNPASLTPADHAEIRRLQASAGRATISSGPIQLSGIGNLAESATIARVSGAVTARALGAPRLTDQALAERFHAEGPPSSAQSRLTARGRLDFGRIDVVTRPPSLEQLHTWRRAAVAAQAPRRIARLDEAIEQRTELDRVRQATEDAAARGVRPDPGRAARIAELLAALATTVHVEGAGVEFDSTGATATIVADRVWGGPYEAGSFGVAGFDVQGIRLPVRADAATLPSLVSSLSEGGGLGAAATGQVAGHELRVREATLAGVRVGAGDSTIGSITITGVRGSALTVVPEGLRVDNFHVDSVVGTGAQIRTGRHSIDAPGSVRVGDIDASFVVQISGGSVIGVQVSSARIESISVAEPAAAGPTAAGPVTATQDSAVPLTYTNLDSGLRVDVLRGGLGGIWARDLQLDLGESIVVRSTRPAVDANTGLPVDRPLGGIERVESLRVAAAIAGWNLTTTVGSQTTGTETAGSITVGQARQGGWYTDLSSLQATDTEVRSPEGSVRVRRLDLRHSRVRFDSQGIYLDALDIPRVEVGALHWRIGTAGHLTSIGGATISNITANARARLSEADEDGNRTVAEFQLNELRVGEITAADIHYADGPIDVRLRRLNPTDPAPVRVEDIVLSNVRWRPGQVTSFEARTGAVGLAVDAAYNRTTQPGRTLSEFGFIGQLTAGALRVGRSAEGEWHGGVQGLGVVGEAQARGYGSTHVDMGDLNLPGITVSGNTVHIPATQAGMLRLGHLELSQLDLTAGGVRLTTQGRSVVRLEQLNAGLTVELAEVVYGNVPGRRPVANPGPSRALHRLVFDQVDIGSLWTSGLVIDVPGVVRAHISSGNRDSSIVGIHVRELAFESRPRRTGRGFELQLAGFREIRVDNVDLRDVQVRAPLDVHLGEDISEPTRRAQAQADYAREQAERRAGTARPSASDWITAFAPLLDAATGHIYFDLNLPIFAAGEDIGGRFEARIDITNGQINVVRLESQVFQHLRIIPEMIDFEVDGQRLYIEFDPRRTATLTGGLLGLGAGALLRKDIVDWSLTGPGEAAAAQAHSQVRIARLLVPNPSAPSSDPLPVELDLARLVLSDLDVSLSFANASPISVTLPGGYGTVVLSRNAVAGLTAGAGGGIPGRPVYSPRYCAEVPPARANLTFGLDRLALDSAALNLPIGTLTTGTMTVSDVRNGRIDLQRIVLPRAPVTAGRPNDTALGIVLTGVSGLAGRVQLSDLVLRPSGGTP